MNKAWIIAVVALACSGCLKDEVELSALVNNPFDPGYTGPAVFAFDTTYVEQIQSTPPYDRQVFQFTVNSALFLAPHDYAVQVEDHITGALTYLYQVPPGSDVLRYYRDEFELGQEVCLTLRLSNNYHQARGEMVCGTLQ